LRGRPSPWPDQGLYETNRANGLVVDKTCKDCPASIAAEGLGLTAYPVGVERGLITRAEVAERTLSTLGFFRQSRQGAAPDATGYKGFWEGYEEALVLYVLGLVAHASAPRGELEGLGLDL
jgi:hypothetical protein